MPETHNKKIALVHDYLLNIGGAERVLKVLHEMFPAAPIYTILYDKKFAEEFFGDSFGKKEGQTLLFRASFLQKLPGFFKKRYKYFSFLIPSFVESLDLSEYDIVISSSSAFSKGIITRPDTLHICYCHTPTRFLWDWTHEYSRNLEGRGYKGLLTRLLMHFLRTWDRQAASRVDYFIANSRHVARRIEKYYGRDAKVIYPPVVETEQEYSVRKAFRRPSGHGSRAKSRESEAENRTAGRSLGGSTVSFRTNILAPSPSYYLIVSQLRSYKQIDVAVEAFKKTGFSLVVIGGGDDKKRLQKLAEGCDNIVFFGRQPDEVVAEYYKNCKAFIFPGEEDFGITMVEAMSYGKPILALRRGGATEIVVEGMTGEFFNEAHPMVLADGLRRLNENYDSYSDIVIKKRSEKFSRERFEKELYDFIEKCFRI